MQKIKGTYATAVVYSDTAEDYALAQVKMICDQEAAEGSQICLMPDIHPGKVGPIGLSMTLKDKVMPALLGVDIGCGISYFKISPAKIEFQKLDTIIREYIPSGNKNRKEPHRYSSDFGFSDLYCGKHIDQQRAILSLGSLGGGNHFLEVDRDEEGNLYYSVTVCRETLDEAPFAYRGIEEIAQSVKDSVEIEKDLKPLYNYRGTERR